MRAQPLRGPRPRRVGAGAERPDPRAGRAWSPTRSTPTTGSSSTCPTPRSRRAPIWCCSSPTRSRTSSSPSWARRALFGARFRENAGRALLIPRARPGKRTPLWQQRLKSQSLLEVAKKYGEFPIILETYRECLRDVLDVPGLVELLTRLHRREITLVEVETADRLAVRLLAAVRLRRHLHVRGRHAQRRAPGGGAVAGPRPAARAARPGGAARPDRPRRAGARRGRPAVPVGADPRRQPRRPARRAAPRRATCRWTRCRARVLRGARSRGDAGRPARRAARRPGADQRRGAVDRRRRRRPVPRRARGRAAPAACRRRSWRTCPTRSPACCAATRATHGPFTTAEVRARYGIDASAALRELERAGDLVRGELRPGGLRARMVRPRGPAPPAPRLAGGPAQGDRARRGPRAGPLPARLAGGRPPSRRRAPGSTGCARRSSRCRGWRCPPRCGSATCCPAASAPTRRPGWTSCAPPARWCGSAPARWAATRAGWPCTSARTWPCSVRRPIEGRSRHGEAHAGDPGPAGRRAPASSPTCSSMSTSAPRRSRRRCGTWPGRARSPMTPTRRCALRG